MSDLDNFEDRHEEVEALIARIKNAFKDRNEILHWLWKKGDDESFAEHGNLHPYKKGQIKRRTAQQLYDVAAAMLQAVHALTRLNDEHGEAVLNRYGIA
jgi:hypothetical protein